MFFVSFTHLRAEHRLTVTHPQHPTQAAASNHIGTSSFAAGSRSRLSRKLNLVMICTQPSEPPPPAPEALPFIDEPPPPPAPPQPVPFAPAPAVPSLAAQPPPPLAPSCKPVSQ